MITDLPTVEDINGSAHALLNMAWETALGVFRLLKNSELENWDDDGSVRAEYHQSRQPALRHALVMVHQAQELGLKARIAEVSPYLLLTGEPRLWPAKCDRRPTSFEEFRTIDASDLLRVHDTVCTARLDPNFARLFEEGRRARNKIVHLGGHRIVSEARDVLLLILETHAALYPGQRWATARMHYELNDGYAIAIGTGVEHGLLNDFALLQKVIEPRHIRRHFGFDRKRRAFMCLSCSSDQLDWEAGSRFAQLVDGSSDQLFCAVCTQIHTILREVCGVEGCRCDALASDGYHWGKCLHCNQVNETREPERRTRFGAFMDGRIAAESAKEAAS
ncbi:hypothetical protein ACVWZA_003824 [Sphingomonas sp. UYAg733]